VWFVSSKAKEERARAERVAEALPDSLRRIGRTEEAARRSYVHSVEEQQTRDATKIPGLSKRVLDVLRDVQQADQANKAWRKDERYENRERRRERAVAAAWNGGRSDPRLACELDRFLNAARQRLGDEGIRTALRAEGARGS
jgi:hypothetical protein